MVIRAYTPENKPALINIFELNVPGYFALAELNDYISYLDKHGDTYFMIEENDIIVGGGGYYIQEDGSSRISWDLLLPEAKGKGYGKKLIEHCLYELSSVHTALKTEVWTSQLAYKFYAKFGFTTREIKKDFWGKGFDLYLMEK